MNVETEISLECPAPLSVTLYQCIQPGTNHRGGGRLQFNSNLRSISNQQHFIGAEKRSLHRAGPLVAVWIGLQQQPVFVYDNQVFFAADGRPSPGMLDIRKVSIGTSCRPPRRRSVILVTTVLKYQKTEGRGILHAVRGAEVKMESWANICSVTRNTFIYLRNSILNWTSTP